MSYEQKPSHLHAEVAGDTGDAIAPEPMGEDQPTPHIHIKTLLVLLAVDVIYFVQLVNIVGSGALSRDIAAVVGGSANTIWLTSTLTILTVVLSPPVSQATDFWGRKWFLVILTTCGVIGSVLVSRANSTPEAIAGQTVSGLSFGAQPLLHAVSSEVLPRRYRAYAQASVNVDAALGAFTGLLVGGILTRNGNFDGFRPYWYLTAALYASSALVCLLCYNPPLRSLQTALTFREKLKQLERRERCVPDSLKWLICGDSGFLHPRGPPPPLPPPSPAKSGVPRIAVTSAKTGVACIRRTCAHRCICNRKASPDIHTQSCLRHRAGQPASQLSLLFEMASASSSSYKTVLITGANAFYAAAIMDRLQERGIRFHGTVRSEKAAGPLRQRYGDSIQVFLVPDICARDAFVESARGCDAIFHVASPFRHDFDDAKTEFLDPAIQGALSALEAAEQTPSVKRVVMTSSVAAILNPVHELGFHRPGYTYTEADWNPLTYEKASTMTAFPPVYTASKGLAEKAAWEFMERGERRHFDLVCINPCHTWGPYTQHVASAKTMNFTNSDLSKLMDGEEKDVPHCQMPWITDISSVADAHIAALLKPEAKGRYLVAAAPLDFQQVIDIMYKHFPDADWIQNVPRGKPGTRQLTDFFTLDNSKSQRELGISYPPIEMSVVNFCKQYQQDRKRWAKK